MRNEQNYFRFHEIAFDKRSQKNVRLASHAASYEDLLCLSETITFKKQKVELPAEERLLEKPELLVQYLAQIAE